MGFVLRGRHVRGVYDRRHCIGACVVCQHSRGRVREAEAAMKNFYIAITFLCAALIALLVLIACALEPDRPEEPQAIAPEVNAEGLCSVTAVRAPEYEMYFTEADVTALARMLYGEARGCTVDNQRKCVWCVLNRVDDARFPDTIIGVVSAPGQFYGYSPDFPVWDNLYAVALDVLTRWSMEKQGADVARELPDTYCWFTGDGETNHFREGY